VPIKSDDYYYRVLKSSDIAIPDSGFMVLFLKIFFRINLKRLSGLEFLESYLLDNIKNENFRLFMVEPGFDDHMANKSYLDGIGVAYDPSAYYIAPIYAAGIVEDYKLLAIIEDHKPKVVLINLGGGVQERIGHFLKENLSYRPAIICTGAAIAFLSGRQVEIPAWADRFYLGWLFRCFSDPRRFVPRYINGLKLMPMLLGCSVTK
jgi:UDP-N-acetyl-D-mannosaminuronic acid transferase (WecB/TagA/CpsF family)